MYITKEEAKNLLLDVAHNGKSYAQNLYELWLESFDETMQSLGHQRHIHGPSVYAMVTWSNMVSKIKKFVLSDATKSFKIRIEIRRNMVLLVLKDKIALRFKKLDKYTYSTKNNTTKQVVKFKTQTLEFSQGSQIACIDVGYRLDALGIAISDIFFVYPKNLKDFFWSLALPELNVNERQMTLFETEESDTLPIVKVKPNVKKGDSDDKKAS